MLWIIVRGSNNKNESNFKLTLERVSYAMHRAYLKSHAVLHAVNDTCCKQVGFADRNVD